MLSTSSSSSSSSSLMSMSRVFMVVVAAGTSSLLLADHPVLVAASTATASTPPPQQQQQQQQQEGLHFHPPQDHHVHLMSNSAGSETTKSSSTSYNGNHHHPAVHAAVPAPPTVLHGITLESTKTVSSSTPMRTDDDGSATVTDQQTEDEVVLHLNGAGLRSIRFLGMDFQVYVAALYTDHPIVSLEQLLSTASKNSEQYPRPSVLEIDATFLRSVSAAKVQQAWREQMAFSILPDMQQDDDEYAQHVEQFVSFFTRPLKKGGTQRMQLNLITGDLRVWDQGTHVGVIPASHAFQRAFLSMWFGDQPISEDLKTQLLLGGQKQQQQQDKSTATTSTATVVVPSQ